MTWLNWSLKLYSSLRTIPHLILTYNTQVFFQLMFISFVWLYMLKCDVYAQLLVDQTQKAFWVFYMFFKVILCLHVFSFCSKCIFVLFFKNLFRGLFARSSRLSTSCKKRLRQKLENTKFQTETFATNSFLRKVLCFISVFSFIGLMWLIFKTLLSSLLCLTRTFHP